MRRPDDSGTAALDAARAAAVELLTAAGDRDLSAQFEVATLDVALANPAHRLLVGLLLVEQLAVAGPNASAAVPGWVTELAAAFRDQKAHRVRAALRARLGPGRHPADVTGALRTLAAASAPDPQRLRRWAAAAAADPDRDAGRPPGRR